MNRKEFINTSVRLTILASIAAVIAVFAFRRQISPGVCSEREQCNACSKNSRCSLPEAIKFRENGEG
ncbi:MAG: hypothetical protein H6538_05960 [Bacteroidales bacterium]|nr:hypothetical protein [Bacteroidales bacterium]MCB8999661.1 hypothetical protein [Bacteroidales bacterium]MCB9012758.1 hypothetical protein [Bacteroidales bacterium]